MNLKIALNPQQGYNKIFDVGEYGMKLTKFGLLRLAKGTTYEGDTGESEVAPTATPSRGPRRLRGRWLSRLTG